MKKSLLLASLSSLSVASILLLVGNNVFGQGVRPWDELRSRTRISVLEPVGAVDNTYVKTPNCMAFSASAEQYVMLYGENNNACKQGSVKIGLKWWGETAPSSLDNYLNAPLMRNAQPQQLETVSLKKGMKAWFRVEDCSQQRCTYSIRWIYHNSLYGILGIGNKDFSRNRLNFIEMASSSLR
jgi:hypothetical protein